MRFSVTLIFPAARALTELVKRTGLSKTDTINRSIQVYDVIDQIQRANKEILIRNPETGETEKLHII